VSYAVTLTLMFFAAIGYAGAGVSFAIARTREVEEAETDLGMRAVSVLLLVFGIICTLVSAGIPGVLGYGGAISWFSYVFTAHRAGVFRIEQNQPQAEYPAERRRIA
jgi:hypothetical protein